MTHFIIIVGRWFMVVVVGGGGEGQTQMVDTCFIFPRQPQGSFIDIETKTIWQTMGVVSTKECEE